MILQLLLHIWDALNIIGLCHTDMGTSRDVLFLFYNAPYLVAVV